MTTMEKGKPVPLYPISARGTSGLPPMKCARFERHRSPLSPRIPYRGRPMARRAAAILVLAILLLLHVHAQNRELLLAKFSPTIFNTNDLENAYRVLGREGRGERAVAGILERRLEWEYLGGGREGDVFAHDGLAIKVYDERRSPARNCVPGTPDRWPTEVPATLLVANGSAAESFVPVVDYFFSDDEDEGRWHLVTPFYEEGTLENLAERLRKRNLSAREIDTAYRPSLVRLLAALGELHDVHGLCHDDVKPENIFIGPGFSGDSGVSATNWLLSDLGNARHIEHPYHASALWEGNAQLRDCRANDVLRLMKAYMWFLRSAAGEGEGFDLSFLEGCEEWSCMYWRTAGALRAGRTAGARGMVGLGAECGCGAENVERSVLAGRYRGSLEGAVTEELRLGLGDKWARFWGLAAVRGVPTVECGY